MDATERLDWQVLETIDPFGQRRDDYRIGVLAQVLVQALGGKKADGKAYLAADFLQHLHFDGPRRAAPARAQTAAEIERRIERWIGGSNAYFREQKRGG